MWAVVVLPISVMVVGAALRVAWVASRRSTVADRLPRPAAAGGLPSPAVGGGSPGRYRHGDGAAGARLRLPASAGEGVAGFQLRLPSPAAWLEPALVDAAVDVPATTAWCAWLAAVVLVTLLAAAASGPAAAVLSLLAVGGLPPLALRSRRGRGDGRLEKELPLVLESIARSLRSGGSVRQAIGEAAESAGGSGPAPSGGSGVGPSGTGRAGPRADGGQGGTGSHRAWSGGGRGGSRLRTELAVVADQAAHGVGLTDALEGLARRRPSPGVRLAVAALCLGIDTGGAQARAVDGVAATMRERLAVEAEVRALSSQARMSALVIGLAPLGFGVFAAATDPRTSDFLLRTPGGLILLGAGLALDGAGWLWMQRLCRVPA